MNLTILTPVYNDWISFDKLLTSISSDNNLNKFFTTINIVAVNDSSEKKYNLSSDSPPNLSITVLNANINVGHQRAIAIGLAYIWDSEMETDYIVVMDSDGEDNPTYILSLVEGAKAHKNEKIIFAKRMKRREGLGFIVFYRIYRVLFKLLTGQNINFGNYSCIPKDLLPRVILNPEIWNHYSGSIIKSKLPYDSVPTDRSTRYHGKSKMNFTNLVLHGLSSISIYIDTVIVKLLFCCLLLSLFSIAGIGVIIYFRMFTNYAISGWASSLSLIIFNTFITTFFFTFLLVIVQLSNRNSFHFLPNGFYRNFIHSIDKINQNDQ